SRGAFQHPCILETFAYFIETISTIPPEIWKSKKPIAALALCTVAVERAFRYWESGELVLPQRKSRKFSKRLWGFAAGEVIRAATQLSSKQWGKIRDLAGEYTGLNGQQLEQFMCQKAGVSTGRAFCVEVDLD
ncbi:hypothetical protein L210DRAFT_877488, partial [Boletus edulis BED1]